MAGIRVKIDQNAPEIAVILEFLLRQIAPEGRKDMLSDMGEYLLRSTRQRFKKNRQQAPDGTKWRELSPAYKKRKKRNKERILTFRGHLQSTLAWQLTNNGETLEVGSNRIYAATQQLTYDRPFLGLSTADQERLIKIATRHLSDF